MTSCRLVEEHRRARALLDRVSNDAEAVCVLTDLLDRHFTFEEAQLLPILAERLPSATGPIPVIREEHATLRRILAHLADTRPSEHEAGRLRALLLSHFAKEEELLLPFAREQLDHEQLARIGCVP